jgi:N-carbamoylputrescine amidase
MVMMAGSSFITNNVGEMLRSADQSSEDTLLADLDLAAYASQRAAWGLFRDRRPDLYGVLLTKDGVQNR